MTMPSLVRRAPILTCRGVVALVLVSGCGAGSGAEAAAATDLAAATAPAPRDTAALSAEAVELAGLTLAPAESTPWREAWRAPGRLVLDPAVTQSLGAGAEGRVSRVLVSVGDRVAPGQPLVAIHSHEMTDARSAATGAAAADVGAETALAVARSAAARAERLLAIRALSLDDAERLSLQPERIVRRFPEVVTVVTKEGRPDLATEAMGLFEGDMYVILRPRSEWTTARDRDGLIAAFDSALAVVPGLWVSFTQPLAMRLDEAESGIRTDLGIKVVGPTSPGTRPRPSACVASWPACRARPTSRWR